MTESLYEIPVNDEFINQILDKPEKFLVPDEKLEKKILGVTKNLFDFGIYIYYIYYIIENRLKFVYILIILYSTK